MSEVPAVQKDPMQQFQDQLRERVRNDIRDLLPEDAVAALVTKAVEDEFFKPRQIKTDSWGRTEEAPSWFVAEVVKAAKPILERAVQKAVEDSPHVVERAIAEYLDQNRLTVAVASRLDSMLSSAICNLQEALRNNR